MTAEPCADCVRATLGPWHLYCAGCEGCQRRMVGVIGPNPWGLTPREAQVMDLMLGRGSVKGAASSLNISTHTVITYLREARRKMAPPHKLGHFIMWDRWRVIRLSVSFTEEGKPILTPSEVRSLGFGAEKVEA